jgi:hypothetical protein
MSQAETRPLDTEVQWVRNPKDCGLMLNVSEVARSLRDPDRLVAADDLVNRQLAADLIEQWAAR